MFRFLRRHRWILIAAMAITCISFVVFMGSGPSRASQGSGSSTGNYGTIYGHELTGDEISDAERDFYLYYFVNYGEWPDKSRNVTPNQIEQQKYLNIMFELKAKQLGVSVPDDAVADAASRMLGSQTVARAVGTPGQAVQMDTFVQNVLQPRGLTVANFEHFVRSQLVMEQLHLMFGLPGSLITPQEAGELYDRESQEFSAQAVFFSTSNYLAEVPAQPAAVAEFFTNNMAYYRVPDRLQVDYVWFNITNYLASAEAELLKTNSEEMIDKIYRQYGATEFADAKTPEEAKAEIRQRLIRRRALGDAAKQSEDYQKALYAMDPVKPENILTLAKQDGVTAGTSAPFAEGGPSAEFANAPEVVKTAFTLTADSPFSDLIAGNDGVYIIGLANQLPSFIPSFADIKAQVEQDFRTQSAMALASQAGTNFYITTRIQMAHRETFAQAAVAEGETPVTLSPFSMISKAVPEAGNHADINELKQAAFTTAPGQISRYMPTADGGFVLFLQKMEPVDQARKTADMGSFTSQLRRSRENEAFSIWFNVEASRELRTVPAFQKTMSGTAN